MTEFRKVSLMAAAGAAIVLGGMFFLKKGEANIYHQTRADHILTLSECMACHSGGSSNRPVSICLNDHCLYTNDHPVLRSYPPAKNAYKFASAAEIQAAGCILENGKVTCLSCHDLTKPPPHLIRDGDELCYICHKYLRSTP